MVNQIVGHDDDDRGGGRWCATNCPLCWGLSWLRILQFDHASTLPFYTFYHSAVVIEINKSSSSERHLTSYIWKNPVQNYDGFTRRPFDGQIEGSFEGHLRTA